MRNADCGITPTRVVRNSRSQKSKRRQRRVALRTESSVGQAPACRNENSTGNSRQIKLSLRRNIQWAGGSLPYVTRSVQGENRVNPLGARHAVDAGIAPTGGASDVNWYATHQAAAVGLRDRFGSKLRDFASAAFTHRTSASAAAVTGHAPRVFERVPVILASPGLRESITQINSRGGVQHQNLHRRFADF